MLGYQRMNFYQSYRGLFTVLRESKTPTCCTWVISVTAIIIAVLSWIFPRSPEKQQPQLAGGAGSVQPTSPYSPTQKTNSPQEQPASNTAQQSPQDKASSGSTNQ